MNATLELITSEIDMQNNANKPKQKTQLELITELTPLPAPWYIVLLAQVFYFGVIFLSAVWFFAGR